MGRFDAGGPLSPVEGRIAEWLESEHALGHQCIKQGNRREAETTSQIEMHRDSHRCRCTCGDAKRYTRLCPNPYARIRIYKELARSCI